MEYRLSLSYFTAPLRRQGSKAGPAVTNAGRGFGLTSSRLAQMELQEPLWCVRIVQISKVMAVEGAKGEEDLVPVL